jgi:broad specificity phosphatase PhoE
MLIPPNQCVFLVRHGRTPLNADGRLRGHLNPSLDEVGRIEVTALADTLAGQHIVKVVTSPLRRALQTAEAIAGATGAPTAANAGLVDRDYGEWAGELEAEVVEQWGSVNAAPGVESIVSVRRRSRAVLEAQLALLEQGNVVLVSHDAVLQVLLGDLGASLTDGGSHLRTASWSLISRKRHLWTVEMVDQPPAGIATEQAVGR